MSKQELLIKFKKDVKKLRIHASKSNISDNEVNQLFKNGLSILRDDIKNSLKRENVNKKWSLIFIKTIFIILLIILIIYVVLNVHQPTSSIVLRNVQGLIYPGFKFLRFFSVPIIQTFPSLTSTILLIAIISIIKTNIYSVI